MRHSITGRRHEDRVRRVTAVGAIVATAPIIVPAVAVQAGWSDRAILGATMVATVTTALVVASLIARLTWRLAREQERFDLERRRWRDEANTDPLCGVANRRGAHDELARQRAGAAPTDRWSVLVFDVDRFKEVNDVHGHAVGDRLLLAVADELSFRAPPGAVVARWGGDEFIVATCGPTVLGPEIAVELAAAVSARPVSCRAGRLAVSVSVGLADGGIDEPFDAVFARADGDLLDAKALRRLPAARTGAPVLNLRRTGGPAQVRA